MRYFIDFDRTINQLVPYYLGGRKLILYLQALVKPLQQLIDVFSEYAKETKIEAAMTSQIFYFEWYLNRKFQKYFLNSGDRIHIINDMQLGVAFQYLDPSADHSEDPVVYNEDEDLGGESTLVLYRSTEQTVECSHSFVVSTPQIDTSLISSAEYEAMLKTCINKYRIAGKTYLIKYYQ